MTSKGSVSPFFCTFLFVIGSAGLLYLDLIRSYHQSVELQLKLDHCVGESSLRLKHILNRIAKSNQDIFLTNQEFKKSAMAVGSNFLSNVRISKKALDANAAMRLQDQLLAEWNHFSSNWRKCGIETTEEVILPNLSRLLMREYHRGLFPTVSFGNFSKGFAIQVVSKNRGARSEVSGGSDGLRKGQLPEWRAQFREPKRRRSSGS